MCTRLQGILARNNPTLENLYNRRKRNRVYALNKPPFHQLLVQWQLSLQDGSSTTLFFQLIVVVVCAGLSLQNLPKLRLQLFWGIYVHRETYSNTLISILSEMNSTRACLFCTKRLSHVTASTRLTGTFSRKRLTFGRTTNVRKRSMETELIRRMLTELRNVGKLAAQKWQFWVSPSIVI